MQLGSRENAHTCYDLHLEHTHQDPVWIMLEHSAILKLVVLTYEPVA